MIKATDLKIEYLTGNPTIDIVSPKLLWKYSSSHRIHFHGQKTENVNISR